MQLRVARLCLDCEELHVENRCTRCASERYAFLTNWLPSEERRKWRRPQAAPAQEAAKGVRAFIEALARWHRGERGSETAPGPLTRASDQVLPLDFEEPTTATRPEPDTLDAHFSKHNPR